VSSKTGQLQREDTCFALATQASEEAGSGHSDVVQRDRLAGLREDDRFHAQMNELVRHAIFVDGVEEQVDVPAQLTPDSPRLSADRRR
jgi:hypothetical protein